MIYKSIPSNSTSVCSTNHHSHGLPPGGQRQRERQHDERVARAQAEYQRAGGAGVEPDESREKTPESAGNQQVGNEHDHAEVRKPVAHRVYLRSIDDEYHHGQQWTRQPAARGHARAQPLVRARLAFQHERQHQRGKHVYPECGRNLPGLN